MSHFPSFLMAILILTTAADAALVRGPYLQMANPQAISVRWRTDTAGTGTVRYGLTAGNLDQSLAETVSSTEHELRITGLSPATKYYYGVEVDNVVLADGADYYFTTPPVVGSTGAFRFWVLGDAGTRNPAQFQVRNAFGVEHALRRADFVMMLGDNAYYAGSDSEYQTAVFDIYPDYLRQLCWWSCLGNHEVISNSAAPPYFDIFTFPINGECGGVASGTEHYFSFDYANVHFVSLDFMQSSRLNSGAQATWLQEDLQNSLAPWTVVFFHHPPYTHGSHNSDGEGDLIQLRQNFMPILENAGVDLVLSGHSHCYERSWFMRGHYGYSTSFNAATHIVQEGDGREDGNGIYQKYVSGPNAGKGTVYIVAGSSGQATGGTLDHPAMYESLNTAGSLVVDVEGDRMDVRFLNSTGTYDDHFSMEKTVHGPLLLPGKPLNLALLPSGPGAALLRWDDVAAENSYDIETSADGVAFTTAGSTSVNVTHFSVTGLTNGALVYLRVTARNANGSNSSVIVNYTHAPPVSPPVPIVEWRFTHFSSPADAGDAANQADSDGDGSNNLLEYAFGTNPRHANKPIVLQWGYDEELGVYAYNFDRLARTDLTYSLEVSASLASDSWTTLFTSTGAANTQQLITVPDPAIGVDTKRFARVKITNP
jgi:hypothetical protein